MSDRAARHTCHADGCDLHVPPAMFMCRRHWFMLPKAMRDAVWAEYVPGQENRMDPTDSYLDVATSAVRWIALQEGRGQSPP
jgi:hypothetical protein